MQVLGQLGLHRETSSQSGERERWRERRKVIAISTAGSVRLAMVAMIGDGWQASVAVASATLTFIFR